MLIVSDFHDYYDGAGNGVDKTIVYQRKEKESVQVHKLEFLSGIVYKDSRYAVTKYYGEDCSSVEHFIILFCGEAYKVKKIFGSGKTECTTTLLKDFKPGTKSKSWFSNYQDSKTLEKINKLLTMVENLHIEYNSPVIMLYQYPTLRGINVTVNPRLKDFDFAKVVPPWDAHQKIYQFIDMILTNQKPLVQISDKDLRDSKGFDDKSFKHRK